ncbi:MAG: hypothetical protein LBP59_02280 [Planctomycetaceae bacterium]|jgi:hypothetical protein|nr:hypothetical protein [Planctomycetaceae bacterium]
MFKRIFCRFVAYRLIRFFCLFVGSLFIAVLWIPNESDYRPCNNAIIQKNDWITGYRASYYSYLSKKLPFIPCYATHVVALSGRKDVGFTAVLADEVGRTCINYSGYIAIALFNTIILYLFANIYEFFRLNPSKENYFMRILFKKDK